MVRFYSKKMVAAVQNYFMVKWRKCKKKHFVCIAYFYLGLDKGSI